MDISDSLRCVFSPKVIEHDGSYVIEIPKCEVTHGDLEPRVVYRTAIVAAATDIETEDSATAKETEDTSTPTDSRAEGASGTSQSRKSSGPPVETGEIREVEIETIGDQGDGIARIERGYVTIVPEAEKGDRVRIELTAVRENVAFGEVVESRAHPVRVILSLLLRPLLFDARSLIRIQIAIYDSEVRRY